MQNETNETFEKLLTDLTNCLGGFTAYTLYSVAGGIGMDAPISKIQIDRAETLIKRLTTAVGIVRERAGYNR